MTKPLQEKNSELYHSLQSAFQQPFQGWDFSLIKNHLLEHPTSWDYRKLVESKIPKSRALMDMGTGGGEFLSSLKSFPPYTCATEAYLPNVPIAKARLEPLGIDVFELGGDNLLPLQNNSLDLIINRHEEYHVSEVKRVLMPDGFFLTQQVGGLNDSAINEKLNIPINPDFLHWNLKFAVNELEEQGFSVLIQKEEFPLEQFTSIEALVYYLKAVPWQVPRFSIDNSFESLIEIDQIIRIHGSFDVKMHRFLILAQKI